MNRVWIWCEVCVKMLWSLCKIAMCEGTPYAHFHFLTWVKQTLDVCWCCLLINISQVLHLSKNKTPKLHALIQSQLSPHHFSRTQNHSMRHWNVVWYIKICKQKILYFPTLPLSSVLPAGDGFLISWLTSSALSVTHWSVRILLPCFWRNFQHHFVRAWHLKYE